MNKKFITSIIVIILLVWAFLTLYNIDDKVKGKQSDMTTDQSLNEKIEVVPIEHATMVLKWGDKIIYTDPTGGSGAFVGQPAPDLILLTDIHSDHFDIKTLEAVSKKNTAIIATMPMAYLFPETVAGDLYIMKNNQKTKKKGFSVEAIPMYNLPEKKDSYHPKGRGNGYVVEAGDKRVYISGDTADIPEMRNLKNIDMAFISMNLPYTMSVESAASGVLAFKPKQIYPYHYRGTNGLSDVGKFKELVNKADKDINVVLLNWYKK